MFVFIYAFGHSMKFMFVSSLVPSGISISLLSTFAIYYFV